MVRRTQARLASQKQPTVHYGAYFSVKSYYTFLLFAVFGKMMEVLAQYGWGRSLLLKFPGFFSFGVFSKQGPTQEQMEGTKFQMDFFGEGYSKGTTPFCFARSNAILGNQIRTLCFDLTVEMITDYRFDQSCPTSVSFC